MNYKITKNQNNKLEIQVATISDLDLFNKAKNLGEGFYHLDNDFYVTEDLKNILVNNNDDHTHFIAQMNTINNIGKTREEIEKILSDAENDESLNENGEYIIYIKKELRLTDTNHVNSSRNTNEFFIVDVSTKKQEGPGWLKSCVCEAKRMTIIK